MRVPVLPLAAVAAAIVGVLLIRRAIVNAPAGSFNPGSTNNVAYQGVNAVVTEVVGYEESLGGWLYDLTHPDPVTAQAAHVPPLWGEAYDPLGNRIY